LEKTVTISGKDFDDEKFVERLRALTRVSVVNVVLHANVRKSIPRESEYGRCLMCGSLTRIVSDEAMHLRQQLSVLRRRRHLWGMHGILTK